MMPCVGRVSDSIMRTPATKRVKLATKRVEAYSAAHSMFDVSVGACRTKQGLVKPLVDHETILTCVRWS